MPGVEQHLPNALGDLMGSFGRVETIEVVAGAVCDSHDPTAEGVEERAGVPSVANPTLDERGGHEEMVGATVLANLRRGGEEKGGDGVRRRGEACEKRGGGPAKKG